MILWLCLYVGPIPSAPFKKLFIASFFKYYYDQVVAVFNAQGKLSGLTLRDLTEPLKLCPITDRVLEQGEAVVDP